MDRWKNLKENEERTLSEPQQRTDDDNPRTHEKPEDQQRQKHQWCRPALQGVPGSRTTAMDGGLEPQDEGER
ncbi:hypothetical protein M514_01911 [Trichuris suis]|uniref:Uncharacterized protein n=1 Tax=Trichuris suis TaxID=68888 RepID=A0A085NTJ4_9BILA|nr:hypothetical protein M514_01911 [Trichuris suis]